MADVRALYGDARRLPANARGRRQRRRRIDVLRRGPEHAVVVIAGEQSGGALAPAEGVEAVARTVDVVGGQTGPLAAAAVGGVLAVGRPRSAAVQVDVLPDNCDGLTAPVGAGDGCRRYFRERSFDAPSTMLMHASGQAGH